MEYRNSALQETVYILGKKWRIETLSYLNINLQGNQVRNIK